jgi:hypothetical protein
VADKVYRLDGGVVQQTDLFQPYIQAAG